MVNGFLTSDFENRKLKITPMISYLIKSLFTADLYELVLLSRWDNFLKYCKYKYLDGLQPRRHITLNPDSSFPIQQVKINSSHYSNQMFSPMRDQLIFLRGELKFNSFCSKHMANQLCMLKDCESHT